MEGRLYKRPDLQDEPPRRKTFVDYFPRRPPPQGLTARTDNPSKGKIGCHMTNVAFRPTGRNYICYKVSCFMHLPHLRYVGLLFKIFAKDKLILLEGSRTD